MAISAVSAAENATEDIISISDHNNTIGVEDTQHSSNSDKSGVLKADLSNDTPVMQSCINNTVEVLSAKNSKISDYALGAVNPNSSQTEPILKAKKMKTVTMSVKYKWTTKKIGKYKIKARLWKVAFYRGYVNYLDIILYKNGKKVKNSNYWSKYKYKTKGKWKWWSKWKHGGVDHSYHRYVNDRPIKSIKVQFRY